MPQSYSRKDLLAAFRAENPDAAHIDDNRIFSAIAQEDPELARGISELQGGTDSLLVSRQAASASEFEKNRPAFEKGGYMSPSQGGLAEPVMDFMVGAERAVGLDPMHPIKSAPGAIWNLAKGFGQLAGTQGPLGQLEALKGVVKAPAAAGMNIVEAAKNQNIPEAMQGLGELYATARPIVEPAVRMTKPALKYIEQRAAYGQNRPKLFTTAEGHLQQGLKPDLKPDALKTALNDLKAGESRIGKPVKDIDLAREAADAQFDQELYPERRAIIDPQKDVVVPGSRKALIAEQIADIPDAIRLQNSDLYNSLVNDAHASFQGGDLTLGQLEKLNTSLNKTNRAFHKANFSGTMTQLETVKGSQNVALEGASRRIMQQGMDQFGTGGSGMLRNINGRIGNLIKIQDAIDAAEKTARTEATQPMVGRVLQEAGQAVGSTIRRTIPGSTPLTVNENIASALRKAKGTPPRFSRLARKNQPLLTTGQTQLPAIPNPSYVRGVPAQVAKRPVLGLLGRGARQMPPPPDTSYVRGVPADVAKVLPRMPQSGALGEFGQAVKRAGENVKIMEVVKARLDQFRDLVESGATERTGKSTTGVGDVYGQTAEVERIGGGLLGRGKPTASGVPARSMFPELERLPGDPSAGEIAAAIKRGKGKLYDRIVKAVRESLPEDIGELRGESGSGFEFGAHATPRSRAVEAIRRKAGLPF